MGSKDSILGMHVSGNDSKECGIILLNAIKQKTKWHFLCRLKLFRQATYPTRGVLVKSRGLKIVVLWLNNNRLHITDVCDGLFYFSVK